MFGLKIPISRSEQKDEFDSVSTILSHSSVTRPSRTKRAPPWLSSVGDDGGIFHLELPAGVEAKLVRLSSGDGGSVSSLALGIGCNSEDTGYSSDQDLNSTEHVYSVVSKSDRRKKDGSSVAFDRSYNNCAKNGLKSPNSRHSGKSNSSSSSLVSSSTIHEAEKNFDELSLSKSKNHDNCKLTKILTDTQIYSSLEDDNDDGVCLNKSDLRSSKTSSISTNSNKSDSSLRSLGNKKVGKGIWSCLPGLNNYRRIKDVNSARSSFANRFKNPLEWKTSNVEVKLNTTKNITPHVLGPNLCEQMLGIVPQCRDDCDIVGRPQSLEVIVKSIVPGGPVSGKTEFFSGSWLSAVNGQELTWDNMDALLSSLGKLKKVKLTFKSSRTEKSTVDLESLVNILTLDTQDHHALDNMAAMYISLEGVDPDDPDNTNDGVVYSFPSERNSLHQLQGMFYTLAHLVKDIHRSSAIKNTTLSLENQLVHVAYLQEGSDILVFAMPASCVSVTQINTLLSEFSRLLRVLFGSIETVFTKGNHSVFIDNVLTYLFRQGMSTSASSSSFSSSLSSAPGLHSESFPFVRYSRHVRSLNLPDDLMMVVGKTLSEFESSDFADMSENFYGCRRQYTILGSAFFYCSQLVCSHLAPENLRDLQLYLQHLGILDLTARCSVAQFVAWREVHPTRFCHDIADINNSFGYSEPSARWCLLIVGMKHGLFCSLIETVGLTHISQMPISPDVFYVEQAKACLLKLQTPSLLTALDTRVKKESQSGFTKSDYCATYVNTTGEKTTRLFSDVKKNRANHTTSLMTALHSDWRKSSFASDSSGNSGTSESLYKSPRSGKMYPVDCNSGVPSSFLVVTPDPFLDLASLHRLSTSRHPSIYQYCCLDGLQGTIITGSDMDNSGIFHSHIVHNFYQCCRQIHDFFMQNGEKMSKPSLEDDNNYDPVTTDPHLRGMKEHGILLTFNPHQGEEGHKSRQPLEYWVVGRRLRAPYVKEMFVCFHTSASQSMMEVAFRMGFGSLS